MEFRKLISFGKTSYVMSLPKAWVIKNNLKKGDLIALDENDRGNLIVSSKKEREDILEQKEIVLDMTGKEQKKMIREVASAYINNYNPIIITGKDITQNTAKIRKIIGYFIALEVMEQSSERIIAKDFLNMEKIVIQNSIKKMDMITRSMMSDIKRIKTPEDYQSIHLRDEDVNRLMFLIFRAVKYAMDNPHVLKLYNLTNSELITRWLITTYIEKIADNTKRVANNFNELRSDKKIMQKLYPLYDIVQKRYLDTMKSLYSKDVQLAFVLASTKRDVLKEFSAFSKKNRDNWLIYDTIVKMQLMVADIHFITRLIYIFRDE